MDLWQKMVFPVRRVWLAVAARVKARKNGGGLLKLHDDVRTCEYEDVQVMWELLRRSELEVIANHHGIPKPKPKPKRKPKPRPFWRVFVLSNHANTPSNPFSPHPA